MPLPLAPIALYAVTCGGVALASYRLARRIEPGRRDQRAEDALDDVAEGMTVRREPEQVSATGRLRRVFRFGTTGPALEVDATALGRVKFRKV
jgi:hypothetical protein